MITLENPRLAKLISEKDALVTEGRSMTRKIEAVEAKIKNFELREKAITGKVKPDPVLLERGEKLTEEINIKIEELNKIGSEIEAQKLAAIPKDMEKDHKDLMKQREELERERNKIALKIQKIKDKVVPIIQKAVTPLLEDEFDDIETAKAKGDVVEISTFNHISDFKSKFRKR
jgi:predicted  nucleic acid-binding Zn-ribbon protein